jgi:predicted PurR-regulated permease PerM
VTATAQKPHVEPVPGPVMRPPFRPGADRALTGIFLLAFLYGLHIAAPVFVPIAIALLFALLLSPPVRGLVRIGLPAPVASGIVVVFFLGVLGTMFYFVSSPAADWLEELPANLKTLERRIDAVKKPIQEMTEATQRVENLANLEEATGPATRAVEIRQPGFMRLTLRSTPAVLVSIAATFVLLYFMLASGREIIRKIAVPRSRSWNRRKVIGIVRAVESDMSRYLATVSMINFGLGTATGIMLYLLDVPNAVLWGVVVALLNYAPYVGATISTVLLALVGLLTFEHLGRAMLPAAIFMGFAFLEGQILSPAIVGRSLSLSPLIVFLAVLFSAWMWGAVGALIGVPLLACAKIVCEHVPGWRRVAEIIGR